MVVVGSKLPFSSSEEVDMAGRFILVPPLLFVDLSALSLMLFIILELAHALVNETRALFGDCLFICDIDIAGG
ncbi:hypothetical protein GCM10010217_76000 [Streptomyces tubercidicus]